MTCWRRCCQSSPAWAPQGSSGASLWGSAGWHPTWCWLEATAASGDASSQQPAGPLTIRPSFPPPYLAPSPYPATAWLWWLSWCCCCCCSGCCPSASHCCLLWCRWAGCCWMPRRRNPHLGHWHWRNLPHRSYRQHLNRSTNRWRENTIDKYRSELGMTKIS